MKRFERAGKAGLVGLIFALVVAVSILTLPDLSLGEMIAGKEYRTEKTEGGYWVYWGDEKIKWEPQPWQQEELREQGPIFYDRWTKPGLLPPHHLSLEERQKLPDCEKYNRHLLWVSYSIAKGWTGGFGIGIADKKGGVRNRFGLEWGRNYLRNPDLVPEDLRGRPFYKSAFTYYYPEDVKGLAVLGYAYMDPKKTDKLWLYLSSVRKVRRMSSGAKQDAWLGTAWKNEDLGQYNAYFHHYQLKETELFHFGLVEPTMNKHFRNLYEPPESRKGELEVKYAVKTMDGIGEPCWVLEATPGPKRWWFDKKLMWIGMKTGTLWYEESYDKKGAMIRSCCFPTRAVHSHQNPQYLIWGSWTGCDLRSGFKTSVWEDLTVNPVGGYFDRGYADHILRPEFLLREVTTLVTR